MATAIRGQVNTLDGVTGTSTDTDNSRLRLSGGIWKDFDFGQAAINPEYGWFSINPWKAGTGTFTGTQATAGTGALVNGVAGTGALLEIDCNSTTSTQGYQAQFTGHGVYLNSFQTLYFETMLRAHDIATGPEFFAGHATVDTTIIGSSAVSPTHWVGFYIVDDGVGVTFGMDDNSTVTNHTSDVYSLVDADVTTDGSEWVTLGYRWQRDIGCSFSVNGVVTPLAGYSAANDPAGFMVPSFVCQSSGTTDPLIRIAHTAWAVKY